MLIDSFAREKIQTKMNSSLFGIVKAAHEDIGHGSGEKKNAEVKRKWSNITQEAC